VGKRLQQIAKALGIAPADFLVNKFEEAVKERPTRYEPGKLKSGVADLNKEEAGLLKAYKSIGSERLRQSILSHIKTVAKIEKGIAEEGKQERAIKVLHLFWRPQGVI